MVVLFLCLMQLMMMAHTRVMLDYAAFNAARAGVVHNGNPAVMRSAALLSMLPTLARTDSVPNLMAAWAVTKARAGIGNVVDSGTHAIEGILGELTGNAVNFNGLFPNLSVAQIDILNPGPRDFVENQAQPNRDEIDFDLAARLDYREPFDGANDSEKSEALRKTRLTIRVQWLYVLRVPIANRIVWTLYMLSAAMRARLAPPKLGHEWFEIKGVDGKSAAELVQGATYLPAFDYTDVVNLPGLIVAATHDVLTFELLKQIPNLPIDPKPYMIPMYALHSMPMESNLFRKHVVGGF